MIYFLGIMVSLIAQLKFTTLNTETVLQFKQVSLLDHKRQFRN